MRDLETDNESYRWKGRYSSQHKHERAIVFPISVTVRTVEQNDCCVVAVALNVRRIFQMHIQVPAKQRHTSVPPQFCA